MKPIIKISVLFVIALAFYNLSAKEVFPTDGAMWRTVNSSGFMCDHKGGADICSCRSEGKTYTQCHYRYGDNIEDVQHSAYWGGFRTEGDSVFFNSVANNKDILVYDFSLMVGDTITLKNCFPYNYDYYRPFMCGSMYGDSLVWQAKVTERFYDKNNLLHLKLEHTLGS